MPIRLEGNALVVSGGSDGERAALRVLLGRAKGHVFALGEGGEGGIVLEELGPRAEACREPLNITFAVADQGLRRISNLAHTPFRLDGRPYASIEGFWQGLKFPEEAERRRIAALHGNAAKAAARTAPEAQTLLYDGRLIRIGRPEHWQLMREACLAKFTQHEGARQALLGTAPRPILHRVEPDSATIPGAIMAEIWMAVRDRLKGG